MPNDVKTVVSIVVLIVAAILGYWSGSPIRHEFSTYIMMTAVFMFMPSTRRSLAASHTASACTAEVR